MRAELIAVGSELLLGQILDTNSAWISSRLAEIGVDVFHHSTVGDNLDRMGSALRDAAGRCDVVIVTGGIGPTQDDVTRVAVARLAGVSLERRPELVDYLDDYFARLNLEMPLSNLVQADLPAGARVLQPVGTAAGFAVGVGAATVYCVPGVPREMESMVADTVIPELIERGGLASTVSRLIRTAGVAESAVAEAAGPVLERLEVAGNPTIAFLAAGGETRVRITGKAQDRAAALALVNPVVDELVKILGNGVAGLDDEGGEYAVGRQLLRRGWTLAVAESVSGGNVAGRIVRVPGASDWFRGGVIAYTNEVKVAAVGVDPELLERDGPVSEATAQALAEGARQRLGADVGLAVVGVAGPSPQGGRDVGTVCVAVALPDLAVSSRTLKLPGRGRVELQVWAASAAVDYLRRRLAALVGGGGAEGHGGRG